MPKRRRPIVVMLTTATMAEIAGGIPAAHAGQPVAAAEPTVIPVAGNFFGDNRSELLLYGEGTAADALLYNFQYDVFGDIQNTLVGLVQNSTATPVVGDFDGDGYDEILWYSLTEPEVIWKINDPTNIDQIEIATNAGPTFRPIAGDFTGDGADDIFWYRTDGTDHYWDFDPGPNYGFTQPGAPQIGLEYTPAVGRFVGAPNVDDIVWRRTTTGVVSVWNLEGAAFATPSGTTLGTVAGTTTTALIALDARADTYKDVLFYTVGNTPAQDPFWNFTETASPAQPPSNYPVGGTYKTAAGDFFGDGHDDIYWQGSCSSIWDFTGPNEADWESQPFGCASFAAFESAVEQSLASDQALTLEFSDAGAAVLGPAPAADQPSH